MALAKNIGLTPGLLISKIMIKDIDNHIQIINDSLAWAKEFKKDSFPFEQFKEYRRKLNKIRRALELNCSAAAYGESQVGKSYLMSSLLSSADNPFMIENNGKKYSFIDELNSSGGNNTKVESTGVITRFTIKRSSQNPNMEDYVKVLNLSVVDIILLLADSYYNDVKINLDTTLSSEAINRELESFSTLWESAKFQQSIISEDDIKDINDYIKDVIGNSASAIYLSNFCRVISPVIQYVPYDKWVDVFGLLWNKNPEINRLFVTLINAYKKLDFTREIYVPFDAVLHKKGTLLKINWLDTVCGVKIDTGNDELYTDVYDAEGHLLAQNFNKGDLSALIAELTFVLPESLAKDRKFLNDMDLLDFPGARSREKYKEKEITTVLSKMLRRGKVAYLFNKYSRALQINSVLFCHHNDQKSEPTIGEAINNWIEENIGISPQERARVLRFTNEVAPLFFIATKFNIDLQRTKSDKPEDYETLNDHWERFDKVFPEIIKPNTWFDDWSVSSNGKILPFQNVYPLRDFYWSAKNGLFDGYSDGINKSLEQSLHIDNDFPDYMDRLKESFMQNKFVRKHFADPEETWNDVATLNNDGSKAIIRDLDRISSVLDSARRERYQNMLDNLKMELINALSVYYEPEDTESKNKKVRLIAGDIKRSLTRAVSQNPAIFGHILDSLMISAESLRNIAYDIIVRHLDTPRDFSAINLIRIESGVDISAPRESNIEKLIRYYILDDEKHLEEFMNSLGFELEDVISREVHTLSSIGDVVTKHIVDAWIEHLNGVAQSVLTDLPHADEVVFMLINLFSKLDIRKKIAAKIIRYTEIFSENEQPNAIGDYAALILNNFVSSVGREYISENDIRELKIKAQNCNLDVDFTQSGLGHERKVQPLMEILKVFDESPSLVNQNSVDLNVMRQLPFWDNYQKWEKFVIIGLIYSSDISHCDPVCNEKVKKLIERTKELYVA